MPREEWKTSLGILGLLFFCFSEEGFKLNKIFDVGVFISYPKGLNTIFIFTLV